MRSQRLAIVLLLATLAMSCTPPPAGVGTPTPQKPPAPMSFPCAFSPDGQRIAAAAPGSITLWEAHSGGSLGSWRVGGPRQTLQSIAFSPDGTSLACSTTAGEMVVWELPSLLQCFSRPGGDGTVALAFNPSGELLATTHRGHTELWDSRTGSMKSSVPSVGVLQATHRGVAFSSDGQWLAVASYQGFSMWNWQSRTALKQVQGAAAVLDLEFSTDGQWLCVGQGPKGKVSLFSVPTLHMQWAVQTASPYLAFLPHKNEVIIVNPDGKPVIKNVLTGKLRTSPQLPEVGTRPFLVSPTGQCMLSCAAKSLQASIRPLTNL